VSASRAFQVLVSASRAFQVLVVGGGINGAGVARDLALRGVRVALVERRELGSGTTWASSGMIHGGLRYLQEDPEVTYHACLDSGAIQRIAPHLIFRIPFLMPVFPEDPIGPELIEIGLEMYDAYQPLKNGRPHTRLSREQALRLEPALSPRIECAFTLDEWGVDAARLVAANALDAAERGAAVHTHAEVVDLLREGGSGRVRGARVRDRVSGEILEIEAEVVLNATGPWAPRLAEMAGAELRLRPGKGIHLVFERRLSDVAIYARGVDGRDMFAFPHEQNSMAGTTDDDFGPPTTTSTATSTIPTPPRTRSATCSRRWSARSPGCAATASCTPSPGCVPPCTRSAPIPTPCPGTTR